jgi:hypothetical protein
LIPQQIAHAPVRPRRISPAPREAHQAHHSGLIAYADNNHEQEACALLDDHASSIHLGYTSTPVQYAFAVLSTEMPAVDAAHVLLAATRDDCPNHAAGQLTGNRTKTG